MLSSSKIESLAVRFEPYIDELREFLTSRHVSFGNPEDLRPFLEQLNEPAFQEEVVSMVRSILYREGESLPRTELMEVLAVAVGGVQVEDAAETLHEPMRQLLAFVTFVSRSQRKAFLPDPVSEDEAAADPPFVGPVDPAVPSPAAPAEAEVAAPPAAAVAGFAGTPAATAEPIPATAATERQTNGKLSQTLLQLGDTTAAEEAAAAVGPAGEESTEPSSYAEVPHSRAGDEPSAFVALMRRAYWLPGLLALVLAVVAGLLVKGRKEQPTPTIAASPAPAVVIPTAPKPSAYGTVLGRRAPTETRPTRPADEADVPETAAGLAGSNSGATSSTAVLAARRTSPATARGESYGPASPEARPGRSLAAHGPWDSREGVFLASSGAMASHLIFAPAPGYPKLASFTHTEGQVIVQVVVGRDGRVEATRVLEGPRLLRGAAEHTIRRWRYRPYVVDGHPTDVATLVTVNFRLRK